MDKRFLIYEGFENDVESIFEDLITKYFFSITYKSDSGVFFENQKIILDISYETVPIVWVKYKSGHPSDLLDKLAEHKGHKVKDKLYDILGENFYKDRKGSFERLSKFLIDHFSQELSQD